METVIITDLRTKEAQDAAVYLSARGYDVRTIPPAISLLDENALRTFAESCRESLVGVIHPAPPFFQSPLLSADEESFARARDEGPLAAWCVTKVFGGQMAARGNGCLIYLNSIHAEKPAGHGFLFSMGCAAVQMLQREVNQDFGTQGVRSFFVQRGPSVTDPDGKSPVSSLYYGVSLRYPQRQMPPRGALNPLLAFLLTPGAAPLSGSDLRADGGMTMYYGERIDEARAQEILKMRAEEQEMTSIDKS